MVSSPSWKGFRHPQKYGSRRAHQRRNAENTGARGGLQPAVGYAFGARANDVMQDDDGQRKGQLRVKPRHVGIRNRRQGNPRRPGSEAHEKCGNGEADVDEASQPSSADRIRTRRSGGNDDRHGQKRPDPNDVGENMQRDEQSLR